MKSIIKYSLLLFVISLLIFSCGNQDNPDTDEFWDFDIDNYSGAAVDMSIGYDEGLYASGFIIDTSFVEFDITEIQFTTWPGVGTYTPSRLAVSGQGEYIFCTSCADVKINITEYGDVGERIKGNWSGTVTSQFGTQVTRGEFDIIRDY